MNIQEIASIFDVQEDYSFSSIYSSPEISSDVKQVRHRYASWKKHLVSSGICTTEYLLPTIRIPAPLSLPKIMQSGDTAFNKYQGNLREIVSSLSPWGYYIYLGKGISTILDETSEELARLRMLYRSHIITDTCMKLIEKTVGCNNATVLDIACNHGIFSLDLAFRGCKSTYGIDLRAKNVKKANFLKNYFQVSNAEFKQADVYTLSKNEQQYNVVLNLGLLYHVVNPFDLMKITYDLCTDFAVVDTVVHHEPFSGYIQTIGRSSSGHADSAISCEFHPTYRGLIDLMYGVGFKNLVEVIGVLNSEDENSLLIGDIYHRRDRRCLIGFK